MPRSRKPSITRAERVSAAARSDSAEAYRVAVQARSEARRANSRAASASRRLTGASEAICAIDSRVRDLEREFRSFEYERQEMSERLQDKAIFALGVAVVTAGTTAFVANGLWAWGIFYAAAAIAGGLAIAGTEVERPVRRRYGGRR